MAMVIVGMFCLGLWMVELDAGHEWYRSAPEVHRAFGVLLVITLALRLGWRSWNPPPTPLPSHSGLELAFAAFIHWAFYGVIAAVAIAGYLLATADGRPVSVFGWFEIPAILSAGDRQADIARTAHFYLASLLMTLAGFHALAALRHHVIDRDATLRRMFGQP